MKSWDPRVKSEINFLFLRKLPYHFKGNISQIIFPLTMTVGYFFTISPQVLNTSNFWIYAIVIGVQWYLIVVLICIFWLSNNNNEQGICLLADYMPSFRNSFLSLHHNFWWVIGLLVLKFVSGLFILYIKSFVWSLVYKYFLLSSKEWKF